MISVEKRDEIKALIELKKDNTITDLEDSRLKELTTNLDKHDFYYVLGLVLGNKS